VIRAGADRSSHVVDVAVFAPLGLLATAGTELPAAVERTRRRVHERIVLARFIGELVVRQAGVEVERRLAARRSAVAPPAPPTTVTAPPTPVWPEPTAPGPAAGALPIVGYDSLPAAHVLELLDGLDNDGLATVEAYERVHRRRRTVLGRIEQLRP
jgi:hypothetical protein